MPSHGMVFGYTVIRIVKTVIGKELQDSCIIAMVNLEIMKMMLNFQRRERIYFS